MARALPFPKRPPASSATLFPPYLPLVTRGPPVADTWQVTRLLGDATELLPQLPSDYFGLVMHDPPANSMSGELYSAQFYAELHRVLKDGGSLYHYVGDPASKASGKLFKGILERMRSVGFTEVKTVSAAYGIVAKCSKDKSAQ